MSLSTGPFSKHCTLCMSFSITPHDWFYQYWTNKTAIQLICTDISGFRLIMCCSELGQYWYEGSIYAQVTTPCYLGDLILLCNIIPNMFDVIYSTCHALIIIIAGVLDLIMHNYCEKYHIFHNWAHYDVIISKLTTKGSFVIYIIIDYHIKISCMQFHIKMIRNNDFTILYPWHIHGCYFTILIELSFCTSKMG